MSGEAAEPAPAPAPADAGAGAVAGAGAGAAEGEHAGEAGGGGEKESRVGRRAGVVLGIGAVVGLAVLAGFGFTPALYLLVLAVVGTLMVVAGARLR